MSCDFGALSSIDSGDPEQLDQLMQECTSLLFSPDLWLWSIAFTVVGAFVGALIGRRRGTMKRDLILGAVLGPLGWVISAFLPKATPQPICPACKRVVGATDAHCRFCGEKLNPST